MVSSLLVVAILAFGGGQEPRTRTFKPTFEPRRSTAAEPTTECGLVVFHVDDRQDPKFVIRAQPRDGEPKPAWKWSGPCVADSSAAQGQKNSPDDIVRELGVFKAALGRPVRDDGTPDPVESRRHTLYSQLLDLGAGAMPALARGLADPDVQIRRNVVLFLNVAGGGWDDFTKPKLDILSVLPALTEALNDVDARVRELSAQTIANIKQP